MCRCIYIYTAIWWHGQIGHRLVFDRYQPLPATSCCCIFGYGGVRKWRHSPQINWMILSIDSPVDGPRLRWKTGFSIINHPFWGTGIYGNPHFYQTPIYSQQAMHSTTARWTSIDFVEMAWMKSCIRETSPKCCDGPLEHGRWQSTLGCSGIELQDRALEGKYGRMMLKASGWEACMRTARIGGLLHLKPHTTPWKSDCCIHVPHNDWNWWNHHLTLVVVWGSSSGEICCSYLYVYNCVYKYRFKYKDNYNHKYYIITNTHRKMYKKIYTHSILNIFINIYIYIDIETQSMQEV